MLSLHVHCLSCLNLLHEPLALSPLSFSILLRSPSEESSHLTSCLVSARQNHRSNQTICLTTTRKPSPLTFSLVFLDLSSSESSPEYFVPSQSLKSCVHLSLFCTKTNRCTIISQTITLLHVSTVTCHPQTAYNQYLANLHKYFKFSCW